ncbi:endo alpha-1,4 polygalactosaminidase [Aequorivita echinoideorum]|uniref:Endo alpha-1,4 polygalactosaminidase n=1 Tax=Aequorivita echinoideorum TaxID=1549647 RepID=A0ABS5S536_9FLAO|nr:endo alpha-1,4 polygalactosaminidase [Aequorivita echinoideorum]MBT0608304.1 endo alpha-1,4 polygalactosaminidase [Aequorivita echinoideorum]
MLLKITFVIIIFAISLGCSNTDEEIPRENLIEVPNSDYVIPKEKKFEWRLDEIPNSYQSNADVIDIDAFTSSAQLVENLKSQGKTVIAYLSVGSVENYRPDAQNFPENIIGNLYDEYPDEKWLDIRQIEILAPIIEARFDMIKKKGFDGIEPDNMNGYQNNTGFDISEEDTINYSRWLIAKAHERGLSIGQKNAEELIPEMYDEFDWILTEDAFVDDFYQSLTPYISINKAVFLVEYTDRISGGNFQSEVCPISFQNEFSAVLKNRELTDVTYYCN